MQDDRNMRVLGLKSYSDSLSIWKTEHGELSKGFRWRFDEPKVLHIIR